MKYFNQYFTEEDVVPDPDVDLDQDVSPEEDKERTFREKFFNNIQRVIDDIAKRAGETKKYTIKTLDDISFADARILRDIIFDTADDGQHGMMDVLGIAEMGLDRLVKIGRAINSEYSLRIGDILMSEDGIFDGCDKDIVNEHTPEIYR
jgi:hypothetical protein